VSDDLSCIVLKMGYKLPEPLMIEFAAVSSEESATSALLMAPETTTAGGVTVTGSVAASVSPAQYGRVTEVM
jgi:hypothetical protein